MAHTNPPWTQALTGGGLAVALIRHGQTEWNAQRRFLGASDIPLDDIGHQQAQSLATALEGVAFDGLYSSPLSRALETARYLGEPEQLPQLAELNQGALEGLSAPEAILRYPAFFAQWKLDPSGVEVPGGGESLQQLQQRALAALDQIAARHPAGLVGVVTHQMVIASLTCWAMKRSLAGWRNHGVRNTQLTVLIRDPHGWSVTASGWSPER